LAEVRFQLDEHVAHAVAQGLRRHGIEVLSTADLGLVGATDTVQVEHALVAGRVIFTQDRDFLRLHGRGVQHHGIAFCEHGSRSIGQIIAGLRGIHDRLSAEEMVGRLEYI
jgi:predicted nuclease of predicted toxin-antitoxin system